MSMASVNGPEKKSDSPQSKVEFVSKTSYSDWVTNFVTATIPLGSPEIFRKWSAIAAIAGALERKVWVRTRGSNLYPNLYTVLCGPPGVGKTEAIDVTRKLWTNLDHHHVAHSNVTKASLIDGLDAATRQVVRVGENPPVVSFNSLLIGSNELGVLVNSYDNEFMNTLTDLYDGKHYSESRRTNKLTIQIEHPNLNLLAGCTPGYLRETIPPGAWDQGFMSRVIIVYNGELNLQSLFREEAADEESNKLLKELLTNISKIYGKYTFTANAAAMIDRWHLGGQLPIPDHPRLTHYCTRRTAHILKLSMIAAAAVSTELIIDVPHIQRAMDWLFEAEYYMPDIFKAMATGGDSQVIEDTFHYLYSLFMKNEKTAVPVHRIVLFLQERTPAHNIMRILEVMERAKMIEQRMEKGVGPCYIPVRIRQT